MNATGRLAGKTIVVTRPLAQARALAASIEAAGGQALIFPLLEISAADNLQALHAAIARLADYSLAIFISPNAVDYSLPAILAQAPWPGTLQAAAIGPGTVKALAAHGLSRCLAPGQRFDSEGLLAEPPLSRAQISGKRVLILRGNGGRELLAETLSERGAQVDCITCYQRSGPSGGADLLREAWHAGRIDGITLSSSEALRYLIDLLDEQERQHLYNTPVFVPHARIAANAKALGLNKIIPTAAADAGILAGLIAYNWSA